MKRKSRQMAVVLLGWILLGGCSSAPKVQEQVSAQEASAQSVTGEEVFVGGMPVGIYMETDGVLVLGTDQITGADGETYCPAERLVYPGDYIVAVDQEPIRNKKQLFQKLEQLDDGEVALSLRREEKEVTVRLKAVLCPEGEYKLGIWVRDNVQGLGTLTFMTQDGRFGALGHGIHDMDTSALLSIHQGSLYKTSIHSIQKGENGIPGSMEGMIVYSRYNRLGTIQRNTDAGIYGTVEEPEEVFEEEMLVPVAERQEIQKGKATIRCFVDGRVEDYDIQVTDIDDSGQEINKGIVIEITDPRLLEQTGGIIQGMSGSPILQNGKLIGAVTHVFIQDAAKGYGIFIENMLSNLSA